MFIGHFAVGFASKKASPKVSLGLLLAAALFLDLLWPIFLVLGLESVKIVPGDTVFTPLDLHDYPYSHSLLMSLVWSLLFGGIYFALSTDRRGALVLGFGVFSHWILDVVSHRPDMPLYPGSQTYWGLGLWNSKPTTLIVESLIFLAGLWLYLSVTKPKNRMGSFSFWSLILLLVLGYIANGFGPSPPSEKAIAWAGLSGWLFPLWGRWIDRNRDAA